LDARTPLTVEPCPVSDSPLSVVASLSPFYLLRRPPPSSTLFPYTTLFRSDLLPLAACPRDPDRAGLAASHGSRTHRARAPVRDRDRKSTRLNSSHVKISYAVFCLKKKHNKADRSRADARA